MLNPSCSWLYTKFGIMLKSVLLLFPILSSVNFKCPSVVMINFSMGIISRYFDTSFSMSAVFHIDMLEFSCNRDISRCILIIQNSIRLRLSNPFIHQPLSFDIRIASLAEVNAV